MLTHKVDTALLTRSGLTPEQAETIILQLMMETDGFSSKDVRDYAKRVLRDVDIPEGDLAVMLDYLAGLAAKLSLSATGDSFVFELWKETFIRTLRMSVADEEDFGEDELDQQSLLQSSTPDPPIQGAAPAGRLAPVIPDDYDGPLG